MFISGLFKGHNDKKKKLGNGHFQAFVIFENKSKSSLDEQERIYARGGSPLVGVTGLESYARIVL